MGSKGCTPPPHMRRPLPGPGLLHPELVGPGMHPLPGPFLPFDLLPPPQVMEQKLAAQHVEMQRLASENQRLAATHGTLRQELFAAQHELQILHAQIGAVKAESEQQLRSSVDKIAKMEAERQAAAEPLKLELQQARGEAQNLVVLREELISKAQQLTQDLQRAHADVQQIPALMSDLECLRQEYQHSRATFGYERKLDNDHLKSLQRMEKNYISMTREVEKLRAELTNTADVDRSSGLYGGTPGANENETSGLPVGQSAYENGYAIAQGRGPLAMASGGGATTATAAGAQPGSASARTGYDASRGPGYDASAGRAYNAKRGFTYDAQRDVTYDAQSWTAYDAVRGSAYDSLRGTVLINAQRTGYDQQRGSGYEVQRGPANDASRAAGYDAQSKGVASPHGHAWPMNYMPYGSTTPPPHNGGGCEAPPQGVNPVR